VIAIRRGSRGRKAGEAALNRGNAQAPRVSTGSKKDVNSGLIARVT